MKKLLCILLMIAVLSALLTGCNYGFFRCDLCGQDSFGNFHWETHLGVEIVYCDECCEIMEKLGLK
jgi:hypothetical protein